MATSISSALISGPTLPPASTARASPALGAPAGKRSRTRREKKKKKRAEGGERNEKRIMSDTLSYSSAGCVLGTERKREKRLRASVSDPSESRVNNPGLFAVLMLISTHTHTHTNNTFCHHFPSPPLLADTSLSFSLPPPASPPARLHLPLSKAETPLVFFFLPCHLGPTQRERERGGESSLTF